MTASAHDDGYRAVTNFEDPAEPMETGVGTLSYGQWLEVEKERWGLRGLACEIRTQQGKQALFVQQTKSWVFLGGGR